MRQSPLFTRGIADPETTAGDFWATPPHLFKQISEALGGFDIDVCAVPETAKCARFFTPEIDGLEQDWAPLRCFANPPYSTWYEWVEKATREARMGASVCLLIPPKTETKAWREYCLDADAVVTLEGRVSFHVDGKPKSGNTYGSLLVIWDREARWDLSAFMRGPVLYGWRWKP